jgi:phosphatidylglycerophosphatase A
MRPLILFFSSGFGSGYIPFASGTWGTGVAILLYWPLARLNQLPSQGGKPWLYALIVLGVIALGTWAADEAEKFYKVKDSGKVVIDEIAGFFVTMFFIPFTWYWLLGAFLIFRLFDVIKPGPIRRLQHLKGGVGIMIDDVLAGALGCVVLNLIQLGIGLWAAYIFRDG